MIKVKCPECGSGSIRYARKDNMCYCMRCGAVIDPNLIRSKARMSNHSGGND